MRSSCESVIWDLERGVWAPIDRATPGRRRVRAGAARKNEEVAGRIYSGLYNGLGSVRFGFIPLDLGSTTL